MAVSSLTCAAQANTGFPSPVGVWRQKHIRWIDAPKDLGYKERGGNSGILRFSEDGSFTLVYTVIYQRPRSENPSQGDSWTIYFGHWKRLGDVIEVTYSIKYRDIPMVGRDGHEICASNGKEAYPLAREENGLRRRGLCS
jgi:hypothetical protein